MADYYWTKQTNGGTGSWSNVNMWASTTGGVGGTGAVPTTTDNAYFDANSFAAAGEVVTIDVVASCANMDWTGATNNPTLTSPSSGTTSIQISGNLTLIAAMTFSLDATHTYIASYGSAAKSWTTAGNTITCEYIPYDFSGSCSFLDDFKCNSDIYTEDNSGTRTTNSHTISCANFGGSGIGTWNFGASIIKVSSSFDATNVVINCGTSTINMLSAGSTFTGGGQTYSTVVFSGATHTIVGSNTFTTLSFQPSGTQTITFTDGTTQTVTNFTGTNGTNVITMQGSSTGGWNLTKSGGGVVSMDYLALSYSNASPSTLTWYAGTHSTNTVGNTGWIFTAPPVTKLGCVIPLGFVHGR